MKVKFVIEFQIEISDTKTISVFLVYLLFLSTYSSCLCLFSAVMLSSFDVVLLLLSPSFSANPDLCHRSGNSHWLLCRQIHIYYYYYYKKLLLLLLLLLLLSLSLLLLFRGRQRNNHSSKSCDKIDGKEMFYVELFKKNFYGLFVCSFSGSFPNLFLSFILW